MLTKQTLILVYFYSYLGSQLNIQLINGTINTWTFGSGQIHLARECILLVSSIIYSIVELIHKGYQE